MAAVMLSLRRLHVASRRHATAASTAQCRSFCAATPQQEDNVEADVRTFITRDRLDVTKRPPAERVQDWDEVNLENGGPNQTRVRSQSGRCMDCGTPFCQSATGCPIGNVIPEFNALVSKGDWTEAYDRLSVTNNFPEFTGRVCPAPCEGACVLGINSDPVTIKSIESMIADHAFEEDLVEPGVPHRRSPNTVAVVGSGPAGLAAADQLNRAGHNVTVFEREDRIGGLLMYGIPNMKLDKAVVQRRVDLLEDAGIKFVTNVEVGRDMDIDDLTGKYDAVLLAIGATVPRDLDIPGRDLDGVHFAMDYITPATKRLLEEEGTEVPNLIDVEGKKVVVIGGGDTGVDCIATSLRQQAASVQSLEILSQPPSDRASNNPWPMWPRIFRTDYAHHEAIAVHGEDPRLNNVTTKRFLGDADGKLTGLEVCDVQWIETAEGMRLEHMPDTARTIEADYVFLSMGFTGPEQTLSKQLDIPLTNANNYRTKRGKIFETEADNVWIAGDCRRGQSLVVWAIDEGRQAARQIDIALMGQTALTVSGGVKHLTFTASLNASKEVSMLDPAITAQRDRLLNGIGW